MFCVTVCIGTDEGSSLLDVFDGPAKRESADIVKYVCIVEDGSDYAGVLEDGLDHTGIYF